MVFLQDEMYLNTVLHFSTQLKAATKLGDNIVR